MYKRQIWDLVIFDEYHFGAWKENAKKLFEPEDEEGKEQDLSIYDRGNAYDETFLPISTKHYLYLSGTPFRALNSGEFIEEQIYNWTCLLYTSELRRGCFSSARILWCELPSEPGFRRARFLLSLVHRAKRTSS